MQDVDFYPMAYMGGRINQVVMQFSPMWSLDQIDSELPDKWEENQQTANTPWPDADFPAYVFVGTLDYMESKTTDDNQMAARADQLDSVIVWDRFKKVFLLATIAQFALQLNNVLCAGID